MYTHVYLACTRTAVNIIYIYTTIFCPRQRQRRRENNEEAIQPLPQPARTQGHPGFIPMRCMVLINLIKRNFPPTRPMHFANVDAFASKAAISRAFRHRGLPSIALDLAINPNDESRLQYYKFLFHQHVSNEVMFSSGSVALSGHTISSRFCTTCSGNSGHAAGRTIDDGPSLFELGPN